MERLAGRIILLWGWRRAVVAMLAGAFAVLTQAPFDFFAAGFVSFPILVWLIDGATGSGRPGLLAPLRPAFATGWWFGVGYFLAGTWWIGSALLVEADTYAWALPFAVVALPMALAVFYGLAAVLARLFWSDGLGRIAALAFGFGVAEWLRSFVLTGFPWNPIGLGAMPVPVLMQSVGIVGMAGMNVLTVFVFAMPGLIAGGRHLRGGVVVALVLLTAHVGYGAWRLDRIEPASTKSIAVRIVQPDIDLSEKWDGAVRDRIFATMLALSSQPPEAGKAAPRAIIWPETSVPFLFTDRPDALVALGALLEDDQVLLAGAVRAEAGTGAGDEARYYNSVVSIDGAGAIVDAVDKVHLVPFGEYLPFAGLLARVGLTQLVAGPMNFEPGSSRHSLSLPNNIKAAPFICYEMIFPGLVRDGSQGADVLVNVTNDAWFGETPGPYQHFRQAQIRAVETGRTVLRAANTGISGVIDPQGRVVDALALGSRGVIDAEVSIDPSQNVSFLQPQVSAIGVVIAFGLFAAGARLRRRRTDR